MRSWIVCLLTTLLLVSVPAGYAQDGDAAVLAACPGEGDAHRPDVRALNLLKRRMTVPQPKDMDPRVTLSALTAPGDDTNRWDAVRGATLEGYVANVKVGGVESVNCHTHDPLYRDTHIELTLDPLDDAEAKHVIVEVTPQWRAVLKVQGVDWSTPALRRTLLGRWIRVTGWLLFDGEHADASLNTATGSTHLWRATAWEIHPITKLEVLPAAPAPAVQHAKEGLHGDP